MRAIAMILPILWDFRSGSLYKIPDVLCRYKTPRTLCRLDGSATTVVADELWHNGSDITRVSRVWSVPPTRERARFRWNDTTAAHLVSDDNVLRVGIDGRIHRCHENGTSDEAYRIRLDRNDFIVSCTGLVDGLFSIAYTWNGTVLVLNDRGCHPITDTTTSLIPHRCAVGIHTRKLEGGPVYAAVRLHDDSFDYLRILCDQDIGGCRLLERVRIEPFPHPPRDFGIASHGHVYFLFEDGSLLVRHVVTHKTSVFRVPVFIGRIAVINGRIYGLRGKKWFQIAAF